LIAISFIANWTFGENHVDVRFDRNFRIDTNEYSKILLLKKYDKIKWNIIDFSGVPETKYMEKKRLLEELKEQRKAPEEKKTEVPEDDLFKNSFEESEKDIEKKEYQRRRDELVLLGKNEIKKRLNAMGKRYPTIKQGEGRGNDEKVTRAVSILLDKRNRNLTEEQILLLLG